MWKTLITTLVAIPVLALFGGIGFLAYTIGQHWDARSTDSLVVGLVATCGGGAVIIGVLLALIIGVPLALRSYSEAGRARREWQEPPSHLDRNPYGRNTIDTEWQRLPPALPAPQNQAPPWGATGGGNYQLLPPQDRRFGESNAEQGKPGGGYRQE